MSPTTNTDKIISHCVVFVSDELLSIISKWIVCMEAALQVYTVTTYRFHTVSVQARTVVNVSCSKTNRTFKMDVYIFLFRTYNETSLMTTDIEQRSRNSYTALCNGIVSHGALIGGIWVFADHTRLSFHESFCLAWTEFSKRLCDHSFCM